MGAAFARRLRGGSWACFFLNDQFFGRSVSRVIGTIEKNALLFF